MIEKLDMKTPDFTNENIAQIAALFPNCVTEMKDNKGNTKKVIDFDLLKQELSENIVDGVKERYSLTWPGKKEALVTANKPINKTLRPDLKDSVNFDTTQNLFIEGDNLDALKLLQESYLNKIKVIYIDPPYNTGEDFIYNDCFINDKDEELKSSGQISEEGRLVVNLESNGRYHSDWLSMMYPRLKLARNLLKENGLIFVSIGVEEVANLKKLMDDIFGEYNFIEIFSWVKTSTPPALSTKSRKTNEYILCYEKNKNNFKYNGEPLDGGDQPLLNTGNNLQTLVFPKEKVFFKFKENGSLLKCQPDRVELIDDIVIKNGYSESDFRLKGEFKWTQSFLNKELENGTTFIIKSDKLSIRFIRSEDGFKRPTNLIKEKYTSPLINKPNNGVGTNENASSDLQDLMGDSLFSNPKPVSLIKHLVNFVIEDGDYVLDFFAGSGTTAHAIMDLSSDLNINIHFILVQLPENLEENLKKVTDTNTKKIIENGIKYLTKLGKPHYLSEITKQRLIISGQYLLSQNKMSDIGFRVLKIDSSNMNDVYYSPDEITQDSLFDITVDNIKEGRNSLDLLFQVLLDSGIDLTLPIRSDKILDKEVFFVDENVLVACFEDSIDEALVTEIAKMDDILKVVFKDSSFKSDAMRINVEQIFKQYSPDTDLKVI
ncbi:MAG: site-specific DNA-methyltransferase [Arcobacteraceae bacterium]